MVIIDILVSARVFSLIGDSLREEIASYLIGIFTEINTSCTSRLGYYLDRNKWAVKWSVYPEGKNMSSMIITVDLSFVEDIVFRRIPKEFPLENNLVAPIHNFFDGFLGARETLAEVLKDGIIIRAKR